MGNKWVHGRDICSWEARILQSKNTPQKNDTDKERVCKPRDSTDCITSLTALLPLKWCSYIMHSYRTCGCGNKTTLAGLTSAAVLASALRSRGEACALIHITPKNFARALSTHPILRLRSSLALALLMLARAYSKCKPKIVVSSAGVGARWPEGKCKLAQFH
jgi:hypothetical protein